MATKTFNTEMQILQHPTTVKKALNMTETAIHFPQIKEKLEYQLDISIPEARWLYHNASDQQLKSLAQQAKLHHHSKTDASYLIMGIINYTNICVAGCDYCAFYKYPHEQGTYLLTFSQLCARIDNLIQHGSTMIAFNGGFHPDLDIYHYAKLFEKIHLKYPNIQFYDMTIAEFMFACKRAKVDYPTGAKILNASGVEWVPGGGAEILSESFRKRHSPGKFTVTDYYQAQADVLRSGLGSTATMVIGFDESLDERFEHLASLRQFQQQNDSTLPSFLCWTYKPYNNQLGGAELDSNTYLRWLAICRIYLTNFKHIRTSVLTKNEQALKGLDFGANDFDLPLEDEVTEKAGAKISSDLNSLIQAATRLGYQPKHRGGLVNPAKKREVSKPEKILAQKKATTRDLDTRL